MKLYRVVIGGIEHTMQFSDEDAKERGLTASDEVKSTEKKASAKPANKSRTAKDKA